jgi:nuclear pore complex protein Nup155
MKTLEDMSIKNRNYVPAGWAPRVMRRANVPYQLIFELMYQMYESQVRALFIVAGLQVIIEKKVPPYNVQENVQALSADLSVILKDWLDAVTGPRPTLKRSEFPADPVIRVVDAMLKELSPTNESRSTYEVLKTRIRQEF